MKHYGDITKINGSEVPIVDIVCGGSPCQDLSVAGKRAGLAGERSGLFMEQIRIIKEMRNESIKQLRSAGADDDLRLVRPRYMVWENVPGAFSSNGGEDFRAVLEETARIADENAVIPRPSGKWTNAGCIMGDGWSIAWRLHDAQFWGVPQRRRRIALVADFGGETAPEILFERESVSGNLEPGRTERKRITNDTTRRSYQTEPVLLESNQNHATVQTDGVSTALPASMGMGGGYVPMVANTLTARYDGSPQPDKGNGANIVCAGFKSGQGYQARSIGYQEEIAPTLPSEAGGNSVPAICSSNITTTYSMQAIGEYRQSDKGSSIKQRDYKDCTDLVVGSFYPQMKAESQCWREDDKANTLVNGTNPGFQNGVCIAIDRAAFNQGQNAQYDFSIQEDVAQTIVAKGPGGY